MTHFKRTRPRIDKGGMDRGLPKADLLDKHPERTTKPSRKPRGYCIKAKGPHEYVFVDQVIYDHRYPNSKGWYRVYDHYRCSACGKKKTVDVTPKGA